MQENPNTQIYPLFSVFFLGVLDLRSNYWINGHELNARSFSSGSDQNNITRSTQPNGDLWDIKEQNTDFIYLIEIFQKFQTLSRQQIAVAAL